MTMPPQRRKSVLLNPSLTRRSQELRRNATKEERHLWFDFLRTYPVQFQRQRVVNHFILDFYCPKAKVAIELDGSQHFTPDSLAYDAERTVVLNSCNIKVLRFTNLEILHDFEAVCKMIDLEVQKRI